MYAICKSIFVFWRFNPHLIYQNFQSTSQLFKYVETNTKLSKYGQVYLWY